MSERCAECGAVLPEGKNCQALFGECLSFEYTNESYGQVHFLTVACFMIQHGRYSDEALAWIQPMLRVYLEGQLTAQQIRLQAAMDIDPIRQWKVTRQADALPLPRIAWTMTIADVTQNLQSPERYCEKVKQWARATLQQVEAAYTSAAVSTEPPQTSTIDFPIAISYTNPDEEQTHQLETVMRQLYSAYQYLRDHDLSEQSNTSYLLQERSPHYLVTRLADELQELAEVQADEDEHVHSDKEPDTILEASQVGYWLMLIAAIYQLTYDDFAPHTAILQGYQDKPNPEKSIEMREECLNLLGTLDIAQIVPGLNLGFALIGRACAEAGISPLAPAEYDLEQMRKKGLVKNEE